MKPKHRARSGRIRDLPDRCRRLHPQWCLLDRDAASCVSEVDLTAHFAEIPVPDEHSIGSVLALRGYDEQHRINRTPVTWMKWDESEGVAHPVEWTGIDAVAAGELASFGGFFGRKFTVDSDVGMWGLHRSAT